MKLSFAVVANGESALDIRFSTEPGEELSRRDIALKQTINAQSWAACRISVAPA